MPADVVADAIPAEAEISYRGIAENDDGPRSSIIAASSVSDSEHTSLSGIVYLARLDKTTNRWAAGSVRWPKWNDALTQCDGGEIDSVAESNGWAYVAGHMNPSAVCTMVVKPDFSAERTLFGRFRAGFRNGAILVERGRVHFATTHPTVLYTFDPLTGDRTQLYPPPKPYRSVRLAYMADVATRYEHCLRAPTPADCDEYRFGNHPDDPEHFDDELEAQPVIDDATDSLAFTMSFCDDTPDQPSVTYVFRNVTNRRGLEYREFRRDEIHRIAGTDSLRAYLRPEMLDRLFAWDRSAKPAPPSAGTPTASVTSPGPGAGPASGSEAP